MTVPYTGVSLTSQFVIDVLSCETDPDDAILDSVCPPPAVETSPPPVPSVTPPAPAQRARSTRLVAPPSSYVEPPADLRRQRSGAPTARHPEPYTPPRFTFPTKAPEPGESRILKPTATGYESEHDEGRAELERRAQGAPKNPDAIRFLTDEKREKYRVDIGTLISRHGRLFDTQTIRERYAEHPKLTMSRLDGATAAQEDEWFAKGLIWVCVADPVTNRPTFFSHVGKRGRFHHTSFNRGNGVIGAGEWIVKDGALLRISANSGHYQPTIDFLYHAVLHMSSAFRNTGSHQTTVFLYDSKAKCWIDYAVRDFLRKPTAGGRYWAHSRSPLADASPDNYGVKI